MVQLAAFGRLWAATHVLRMFCAGFASRTAQVQLAVLSLAALHPTRPAVLGGAIVVRLAGLASKMPVMHDSQYLAFQVDCVLLFALLAHAAHRSPPAGQRWLAPLTAAEQRAVVAACAPPTVRMLAVFFFAAGFWKINTGFLDPEYSCGTIFFLQLLDHLPSGIADHPTLVQIVAQLAPLTTITVEIGVGLLLLCPVPLLGAVLMLLFHIMIGLTPPPNNIATFGCVTCTRLFFLSPQAATEALHEIATTPRLLAGAGAVAAVMLGVTRRHHAEGAPVDVPLVFLSLLCCLYAKAFSSSTLGWRQGTTLAARPDVTGAGRWQRRSGWLMTLSMVTYALLLPMLGIMDLGAPNMFSNLRMQ